MAEKKVLTDEDLAERWGLEMSEGAYKKILQRLRKLKVKDPKFLKSFKVGIRTRYLLAVVEEYEDRNFSSNRKSISQPNLTEKQQSARILSTFLELAGHDSEEAKSLIDLNDQIEAAMSRQIKEKNNA